MSDMGRCCYHRWAVSDQAGSAHSRSSERLPAEDGLEGAVGNKPRRVLNDPLGWV